MTHINNQICNICTRSLVDTSCTISATAKNDDLTTNMQKKKIKKIPHYCRYEIPLCSLCRNAWIRFWRQIYKETELSLEKSQDVTTANHNILSNHEKIISTASKIGIQILKKKSCNHTKPYLESHKNDFNKISRCNYCILAVSLHKIETLPKIEKLDHRFGVEEGKRLLADFKEFTVVTNKKSRK